MKIDLEKWEEYREKRLISSARHPSLPLTIWAYTSNCQYEQAWDEITLSCRGLVTDDDGNIVAKPFPKFFNMEERRHQATDDYQVYEKLDGTLGIMFSYQGEWVFATKKSFDSEYVDFFRAMMLKGLTSRGKRYSEVLKHLSTDCTYLFELIKPEFKIVVDYASKEELVLIGSYHNETCEETPPDIVLTALEQFIPVVKRYQALETETLRYMKELNTENKEGFVVRFSNGQRCKIKFKQYIQLHALITGASNLSIWKMLRDGKNFDADILSQIPDELYEWMEEIKDSLQSEYAEIIEKHREILEQIKQKEYPSRKEIAIEILRVAREKDAKSWILFGLFENKVDQDRIWKLIRPAHETYWG